MKVKLSFAVVLFTASFVFSQTESEKPTARQLLNTVVRQLPDKPLLITGDIIVRKRRGVVVRELDFEMVLKWGDSPSSASYLLQSKSGKNLEKLVVTRKNEAKPDFSYLKGASLQGSDLPDLFAPIQQTDMSWMDLTLSFLWWKDAKLIGEEKIRGQECYLVEVKAPAVKSGALVDQKSLYSMARLWIDKKFLMLLQAEGYNADEKIVRRLWVKSFKKINETWMIKDMEVQSYPAVHRTKIIIMDVNAANAL